MRLKHALAANDGGAWGADHPEHGSVEVAVWRSTDIELGGVWASSAGPALRHLQPAEHRGSSLAEGDLVVTKASGSPAHIGKTALTDKSRVGDGYSNFMQRLRVRPSAEPRFVWYLLNSPVARDHYARYATTTSGLRNLTGAIIGELPFPALTDSEQSVLAGFLDRECERIAAIARTRQAQMATLDEVRAAEAREAVAGLRRVPLKRAARVLDCKHRTAEYVTDGLPLISTREVRRGELVLDDATRRVTQTDFDDLREGGRDPRRGDIIYSRNATVGVAAFLADDTEVCMGQDVVLITRRPRSCELLSFVLNWGISDQVERLSIGSTFSRINVATIRELVVPDDEADRETAVLGSLATTFARLDHVEAALTGASERLAEYRDALITEAVTGQLDVSRLSEAQMDERAHAALEGATA